MIKAFPVDASLNQGLKDFSTQPERNINHYCTRTLKWYPEEILIEIYSFCVYQY